MTTKRILSLAFLFISIIYFTSCDQWYDERIEGNGSVATKVRSITAFNEVISIGNFDVYLGIADSTSLIVEAEENLFPFIVTKVSGEKFYIEAKDNYNLDNSEPIKIYVTTPDLESAILAGSGIIICDSLTNEFLSLELTGSGRINFDKVDVMDLDAEISGSGDITVSGITDRSDFEITGSGNIRSLDLFQLKCEARITGSGNMYVNVEDYLRAVITGSGNIYYKGDPIIDEIITGTGYVRKY
jgi:hypothetical protein